MVLIAKGFAVQLAGAGVEGAVQGAAMMGLGAAGMATGKSLMLGGRWFRFWLRDGRKNGHEFFIWESRESDGAWCANSR